MRRASLVSLFVYPLAAAFLLPSVLAGQNAQCASFSTVGNARQTCDAAVDFARAYHPIAGIVVAGGNPILGSAGMAGGLGHFSIALRANAVNLTIPRLDSVSATGTVPERSRIFAPAPQIEAVAGVFPGFRHGLLAFDVLASAQLIPNQHLVSDIRVDSTAPRIGPVSLGLGIGGRVGLFGGDGALPSVAVSLMYRSIPRVGYGDSSRGDAYQADVNLRATTVRVTLGRTFSVLSLAGGAGWSRYTGTANAQFDVGPGPGQQGTISVGLNQSRMVYFLDAGVNLRVVRIMGEIGHQTGKDQNLGTTFTGFDDTSGTTFFSAGLRFGF